MSREPPSSDDGFEAQWRSRFTDYARAHEDDASIAGWSSTGLAARMRFFQRNWEPSGSRGLWLDVGCGAGTYARYLQQQGLHAVGIDYSVPSLDKAALRSPAVVHWVAADARKLPVRSASAAGALCFGVTQALAESRALVDELARVTAPGGVVWLDGLNAWCLPHLLARLRRAIGRRPARLRYESPRRLRKLAVRAGFADVRVLWLPILPARLQRFQHWVEAPLIVAVLHGLPLLGMLLSHSVVIRARRAGGA